MSTSDLERQRQGVAQDHLSPDEARERSRLLKQAFRPSAPVTERDLFAGRLDQMRRVEDAIYQPGRHAVIFGERGVGKTSLAAVTSVILPDTTLAVRVNCDPTDNFARIWRKILEEVTIISQTRGVGFASEVQNVVTRASDLLPGNEVTPGDVRSVLGALGGLADSLVFMVDEFDSIHDRPTRGLMASTIKTLSDQADPATIVVVGVADTVDDLIEEHASVERALQQVHMPRMTSEELAEIVDRGLSFAEMRAEPRATRRITQLSQGLPHYTHLLASAAGDAALDGHSRAVTSHDVEKAIDVALSNAQESIVSLYHKAVMSNRETLYPQVVLAAASLTGDARGFFSPSDLRQPLETILDRKVQYASFSNHLHALASDERGPLLERTGRERRYKFRFVNPLMKPYVLMNGLNEGLVAHDVLEALTSNE